MKKLSIFMLLLLFIMPFSSAASFLDLVDDYEDTQKEYLDIREELDDCRLVDDDCSDLEEDILDPAAAYGSAIVALMLEYVTYLDSDSLDEGISQLEDAADGFAAVETKEDFDDALALALEGWDLVVGDVLDATIDTLHESVEDLVDTGEIIDAKLACGIDELLDAPLPLTVAYDSFAEEIVDAEQNIEDAQDLIDDGASYDDILEAIVLSQLSLKNSQTFLETALEELDSAGGELCSEVIIDDDDEDEADDDHDDEGDADHDHDADDEDEADDDEDDEDYEVHGEDDLDDLLDEYGLDQYYDNGVRAIESLESYISQKEADNYDATSAKEMLKEAQGYLDTGVDLVLTQGGSGALSKFFNAESTADRGKNIEHYKKIFTPDEEPEDATEDYEGFLECMEEAGYASQRDKCYDDYDIDSGTEDDIEECLDDANHVSEEEECYELASDEAVKQVSSEEDELQEQLDTLEDDIDDLEDDVTELFNELEDAADDAGLDEDDSDYESIEDDIKALLDDVQNDNSDYEDEIDDIQDLIDDERYDDAEDDLDDLEDDIESYIDDMEDRISDIEDDIDNL